MLKSYGLLKFSNSKYLLNYLQFLSCKNTLSSLVNSVSIPFSFFKSSIDNSDDAYRALPVRERWTAIAILYLGKSVKSLHNYMSFFHCS